MRSISSGLPILLSILLIGCPEPPPDVVTPGQAPTAGGGGTAVAAAAGDGVASPDDPATAGGRIPPGMRIEPPGFGLEEGEGVKLSGSLSYEGEVDGELRVEILQAGGEGAGPQLLHAITLDALGPWSVIAPAGLGEVTVVAYLDRDHNGPSPDEPAGLLESAVDVADIDIAGLDMTLADSGPEGMEGLEDKVPPAGAAPAEGEAVEGEAVEGEAAPTEGAPAEAAPAEAAPPPKDEGAPPPKDEGAPPPKKADG